MSVIWRDVRDFLFPQFASRLKDDELEFVFSRSGATGKTRSDAYRKSPSSLEAQVPPSVVGVTRSGKSKRTLSEARRGRPGVGGKGT